MDRPQVDARRLALPPPLSVFQDHISITPGRDWFEVLRRNAGAASVLVVWATRATPRSSDVPFEVGIAMQAGAQVVPVEAEPGALDGAPAWLSRWQALRVSTPAGAAVAISTLV